MDFPPIFYFDLNVFNKIEKIDTLEGAEKKFYGSLENLVKEGKILVPYSNAHMRDLTRGYHKSKEYMDGHLATIERLTRNLCITQYWNEPKVKWHFRGVREFFESTLNEAPLSTSIYDLFNGIDDNEPTMKLMISLHRTRCDLMKFQPIDQKFKLIYKEDPVFGLIYPRTREEMNLLALTEDILNFSSNLKSDFKLYKSFRKYLNVLRQRFPLLTQSSEIKKFITDIAGHNPIHLTWDSIWDDVTVNYKPSANPDFDRLFDLFVKTDLKGYRQDDRFANLIDDALHVFYGAHCTFFVTNDSRCYDKAKFVYAKYAPKVQVIKPEDIIDNIVP